MTTPEKPPRLPIPGGRQLSLNLSVAGQPATIVLGAKGGGSWTGTQSATTWRDRAWHHFRLAMTTDVTCVGAIVREAVPDGEVIELGAPTTSPNGGLAGAVPLLAAATLVKWSTTQGGRSGKGRTFIPGLPSSGIAAGGRVLTSTHTSAVQSAVNGYIADSALASAGLVPSVLSFRKGAAYTITAGGVNSVVGVQRRRMR